MSVNLKYHQNQQRSEHVTSNTPHGNFSSSSGIKNVVKPTFFQDPADMKVLHKYLYQYSVNIQFGLEKSTS